MYSFNVHITERRPKKLIKMIKNGKGYCVFIFVDLEYLILYAYKQTVMIRL